MGIMTVTAAQLGIQKLYHYEPFCPKYLEVLLLNQRIHLSNPKNFNDPWDCYPCIDTTRMNDRDYRARCIEYMHKFPRPTLPADFLYEIERRLQDAPAFMIDWCQTELSKALEMKSSSLGASIALRPILLTR